MLYNERLIFRNFSLCISFRLFYNYRFGRFQLAVPKMLIIMNSGYQLQNVIIPLQTKRNYILRFGLYRRVSKQWLVR